MKLAGANGAYRIWRLQGTLGVAQTVADRLRPETGGPKIAKHAALAVRTAELILEIGGPSGRFQKRKVLPVYPLADRIDNVNFASTTHWESDIKDGDDYAPAGKIIGTQYLREANNLAGIADDSYDLIVSAHTLEHLANPIGALREWGRVCRPGGRLLLALPHASGTFDRRRPITTIEHMLEDASTSRGECDRTHIEEVLALHDLRRDPDAGSIVDLQQHVNDNLACRSLHHHVFDMAVLVQVLAEGGWTADFIESRRPHDLLAIASNGVEDGKVVTSFGSPFRRDWRAGFGTQRSRPRSVQRRMED